MYQNHRICGEQYIQPLLDTLVAGRLHSKRRKKYDNWLIVKMNSEGWDDLGDRLEILRGADYRGRRDLFLCKEKRMEFFFSDVPPENFGLPVFDMKQEIETFDVEQGYRSIGVTWPLGSAYRLRVLFNSLPCGLYSCIKAI